MLQKRDLYVEIFIQINKFKNLKILYNKIRKSR